MLEIMAIGDAYGAAFEFIKHNRAVDLGMVNSGQFYYPHPELPIGRGRYTDDTQMALGIAEHLLEGSQFTKEALADRFLNTFRRDERPGYGSGFFNLLQSCESGEELLSHLRPGSTRSGAAMRVAPIGLLAHKDLVMDLAAIQAQVTHDSPEGIESAQAISLAVHYFAHYVPEGESTFGLRKFLAAHLSDHWLNDWQGWVSVEGMPCALAAVTAVLNSCTLEQVLVNSVSFGGDVDTVGAMAMAMASLIYVDDIIPVMRDSLENGAYGRDYLLGIDAQLDIYRQAQHGLFTKD
jgi:ADP-ribosylglycohydrolase